MNFPFAEVLSGAALVLAVVSPIITAAINSHTQKREREAVFYLQKQAETFENYLKDASAFISHPSDANRNAYSESRGKIMLLVDSETSKKVLALDKELTHHGYASSADLFELVQKLHEINNCLLKTYPRLIKKRRNQHTK